jgi:hypothetical protein
MPLEMIPDIPRIYTALAEWSACLIYILPLRKRFSGAVTAVLLVIFLFIQSVVQIVAGMLPLNFWLPGMAVAVAVMYFCIISCAEISHSDAVYCSARAFIAAEFTASLQWQIQYYFDANVLKNTGVISDNTIYTAIALLAVYLPVMLLIFWLEARRLPQNRRLDIERREALSAALIALAIFMVNNIHFAFPKSAIGSMAGSGILYIRTLVNFSGLVILHVQSEQRREIQLRRELESMDNVLKRQYEQYQQYRESSELISRQHHDLKHQIAVIRSEENYERRDSYLEEMERAISVFESQNKTGNSVLDTVLTGKSLQCGEYNINFTCVADGTLLDFMEALDICSIFGNALDNAIESVKELADSEKRLIRLAVFSQNDFLMLRIENYYEGNLQFEDDLPLTTKKDKQMHGYGLKSIRSAAEKYGGTMSIKTDDNWFTINVLIPMGH